MKRRSRWVGAALLAGVLIIGLTWWALPLFSHREPTLEKMALVSPTPAMRQPTRPLPTPTPSPLARWVGRATLVRALARPQPQIPVTQTEAIAQASVRIPYTPDAYGVPPLPGVITYTVQPGDTISSIAAHFGLSLDAVRWSNPEIEYNPDDIYPGQVLRLPPLEGVVVEVRPGDTVEKLARRYNVPPDVIRTYAPNRLQPPYTLTPGQLLIIPGGSKIVHLPPPQPYPGYQYMWPVRGRITQRYSPRHRAWDIATIYGAGIYASRAGRVRVVRWDDTGYGYMIIIDHGDGWNTLYAHMKGALVKPGQWVEQGELIGRVGGTGRATGPHVHWEIRRGRTRYDPARFLPPSP